MALEHISRRAILPYSLLLIALRDCLSSYGGNGRPGRGRGRGARGFVAVACCGTRGLRVVLVLGEVAHENVSGDGRELAVAAGGGGG